jgi:hypothetical protein
VHKIFLNLTYKHFLLLKKFNSASDGKTHNQVDHILIDRRRYSSILNVRSFRRADCGNDHYLVVAKVRERLVVSKQTTYKFHMERFKLKKLNRSGIVLKSQMGSQI